MVTSWARQLLSGQGSPLEEGATASSQETQQLRGVSGSEKALWTGAKSGPSPGTWRPLPCSLSSAEGIQT